MSLSRAGISREGREELAAVTSRGRRLVRIQDVAEALGMNRTDAAKKAARWADHGWLRRVRRGLYLAVPVDVESPELWSEDPAVLADAVWAPCYFTGWTAANHWGLTEQIFRTVIVKTARRVRSSRQRLLDHEYMIGHVPTHAMTWGLKSTWLRNRRLQFADPARTVIDILDDPNLGGGIRHGAEILAAYLSDHDPSKLLEYGDKQGNRSVFKRLGFLLDTLGLGSQDLLAQCRDRISSGMSLLDPSGPDSGERVGEWRLRANVQIDGLGSL